MNDIQVEETLLLKQLVEITGQKHWITNKDVTCIPILADLITILKLWSRQFHSSGKYRAKLLPQLETCLWQAKFEQGE